METPKSQLTKHEWVPASELLATDQTWLVCKRCGTIQTTMNEDRECKGQQKKTASK
jgi:hypothetical protein